MSGWPAIDGWTPPSAVERRDLLAGMRTIAMVGVSANPSRPSNFVATYLLGTDHEVYFVNPMADEILGRPCVPTLADLPVVPDCVDVFRRLDDVPEVAELSWMLSCVTAMGLLDRAHAYKAAVQENIEKGEDEDFFDIAWKSVSSSIPW